MIYTLGKTVAYEQHFRDNAPEPTYKLGRCELNGMPYSGGSVWKTREAAEQVANANPGYSVYTVDAVWGKDTEPSGVGDWHDLLRDAVIIESLAVIEGIKAKEGGDV